MPVDLLSDWLVPVLVIITAASATASAATAFSVWRTLREHDRVLFGNPRVPEHRGVLEAQEQTRTALCELAAQIDELDSVSSIADYVDRANEPERFEVRRQEK